MTKIKYYHIVLIFLLGTGIMFSQVRKNNFHPLSNSIVLTFDAGTNYPLTDYENPNLGWLFSGGIEYYFTTHSKHILGITVNGGMQNISGELNNLGIGRIGKKSGNFSTQVIYGGAKIIYSYSLNKMFSPFLSFGSSYFLYDFNSKNIKSRFYDFSNGGTDNSIVIDANSGFKYNISDKISLNMGIGYHYILNDNIDAIAVGDYNDFYISGQVGISFSIWNKVDSDNDGVLDENDLCPNKAEDMDGYKDDDGCPDPDNDGDGILDINDGCQNSKEDFDGYKDDDGCPDLDNDGDGILDINDKCPNKKEDIDGFQDGDGCPEVDNDNDGILDIHDSCPDEAEVFNGYKDNDGCPDVVPKTSPIYEKQKRKTKNGSITKSTKKKATPKKPSKTQTRFLIHGESTFLAGSSQIKSSAYSELNKIASQLKLYPDSRWSIEAHIDKSATSLDAVRISKNQADAIMNYFISKGLSAANFRAIGKGDSSPIASNSSVFGRMKNRRIVIKQIN